MYVILDENIICTCLRALGGVIFFQLSAIGVKKILIKHMVGQNFFEVHVNFSSAPAK